jgi:hypothetical protein
MHPPRLTIGSLLFIVAAFSIGLAALKENDLKGIGLSMLMIIGLLGAALGACSDAGRPRRRAGNEANLDFRKQNPDQTILGDPIILIDRDSLMAYLHDQAVLAGRPKARGALCPGSELDGDLAALLEADPAWVKTKAAEFVRERTARIVLAPITTANVPELLH